MIYFDNAATTMMKPPEVAEAVARAIGTFGGAGRGAHAASLDAGVTVLAARRCLSELLGGPGPEQVAFTGNATESLNGAICGLLQRGDHAVTTAASHNSVLRPLFRLQDAGAIDVAVVPVDAKGALDYEAFDAAFRADTRVAVVTHASNLTGDVYDIARMAEIAHSHDALIVVDAAQTVGLVPIDVASQRLDVVCFTGHKSLFGPQGTGGLCVAKGVEVAPFTVGGSGTHSFDRVHPRSMPERLEAGTLNAHGIAGLLVGADYVLSRGVREILLETQALARRFREGVRAVPGVTVYGGGEKGPHASERVRWPGGGASDGGPNAGEAERGIAIVALNVGEVDSSIVADMLGADYGICVRAGAHCAPLMHRALGTDRQGAVRFSFSHFNTPDQVDAGIAAIAEIAGRVL